MFKPTAKARAVQVSCEPCKEQGIKGVNKYMTIMIYFDEIKGGNASSLGSEFLTLDGTLEHNNEMERLSFSTGSKSEFLKAQKIANHWLK